MKITQAIKLIENKTGKKVLLKEDILADLKQDTKSELDKFVKAYNSFKGDVVFSVHSYAEEDKSNKVIKKLTSLLDDLEYTVEQIKKILG